MEKQITCINCPMGCRLTVTLEEDNVTAVRGNICKRGDTYARQECTRPMRTVTAVTPVEGRILPVSVKTAAPIPKDQIIACMAAIRQAKVQAPVHAGDVIVKNVCDTGVDVIATRDVP